VADDHAEVVLASQGLSMNFGGFRALDGVDITVRRGEILGLLGPNGSGKSTWINCVSGVYRPSAGRVTFAGKEVTGRQPHRMYHAGLGRTFQRLENFPEMTVTENLLLALQEKKGTVPSRLFKHDEHAERDRAAELVEFMGLERVAHLPIRILSYGQQKLADLAMVLMPDPEVVLLDEPMAGVNPALIEDIVERISTLNRQGKTFVIIEHNLKVVMDLCDRLVVLDHGEKLAEGLPEEIQHNEDVLEAYFGS
jgi:branched-chain amino acid transport system ATP-binding protein